METRAFHQVVDPFNQMVFSIRKEEAVKTNTVNRVFLTAAISAAQLVAVHAPVDAQREQPKRKQGEQQSGQQPSQRPANDQEKNNAPAQPPSTGDRQRDQKQPGDNRQQDRGPSSRAPRNDKERQKEVERQEKRFEKYRDRLNKQEEVAEQRRRRLEQEKRIAHARYQQAYAERMRERRKDLYSKYDHDLRNDPFFDAPPRFRYYRGNKYFNVNRYVAEVLKDAVDYGYEQGYYAGRADYEDGWRFSYKDCYAYEDATYGYTGYWVDLNEYRHYFREGFRHGYEDGYYNVFYFGRYENGRHRILADILARIIYFIPLP